MNEVDKYLAMFPEETRHRLEAIRVIIHKVAPQAKETISYGMPAYKWNGKPLVYFAGYKSHIGFYATPTGHAEFEALLKQYTRGKGSVQFPLKAPLPVELIERMVAYRLNELRSNHPS